MANYLHTEGICLRRLDYSNTSQVAAFLTPDAGTLSVMAKGVTRAPKRGVRTGFDLLGRYELIYTPRPAGTLQNLTYRWLREDFRGLRRSLPGMLCGFYVAELALNFAAEGDPCPGLYARTLETLRRLDAGRRLGLNVLRLELGALAEHGTLPVFDRCSRCGGPLPDRGPVTFSPADGGVLCATCEGASGPGDVPPRGGTIPVRADFLPLLAALAAGKDVPDLDPRRTVALSTVLRFHIRYQLGKELRMWKYLQRRELTRSLRRIRRRLPQR